MNIAILGGTGKEGAGLGARWALAGHHIIIGSRDEERARAKVNAARRAQNTRANTHSGPRAPQPSGGRPGGPPAHRHPPSQGARKQWGR